MVSRVHRDPDDFDQSARPVESTSGAVSVSDSIDKRHQAKSTRMRAALGTLFAKGVSLFASEIRCRMPAGTDRRIYLTFDDGPTPDGTPEILDILAQYGIPATFFLVGRNAVRYPALVRSLPTAGHAIGNHSFSHLDAWKASGRLLEHDLSRATKTLANLLGEPPRWMRPPFGRVTPAMMRWCRRNEQRVLLWDMMPPDFEPGVTYRQIVQKLTRGIRRGSVICLHDNALSRRVTPAALRVALPRLLDAGWQFATVD